MKKILLFCFVLFWQEPKTEVLLCMGNWAETYHTKKNCAGLVRCGGQIRTVSLDSAKKVYQRRLCGFCKNK